MSIKNLIQTKTTDGEDMVIVDGLNEAKILFYGHEDEPLKVTKDQFGLWVEYPAEMQSIEMKIIVPKNDSRFFVYKQSDSSRKAEFIKPFGEYPTQIEFSQVLNLKRVDGVSGLVPQRNADHVKFLIKYNSGSYSIGNIGLIARKGKLYINVEETRKGKAYISRDGKVTFPEFRDTKDYYEELLLQLEWPLAKLNHISTWVPQKRPDLSGLKEGEAYVEWFSNQLGMGMVSMGSFSIQLVGKPFDMPTGTKAKVHFSNIKDDIRLTPGSIIKYEKHAGKVDPRSEISFELKGVTTK